MYTMYIYIPFEKRQKRTFNSLEAFHTALMYYYDRFNRVIIEGYHNGDLFFEYYPNV